MWCLVFPDVADFTAVILAESGLTPLQHIGILSFSHGVKTRAHNASGLAGRNGAVVGS